MILCSFYESDEWGGLQTVVVVEAYYNWDNNIIMSLNFHWEITSVSLVIPFLNQEYRAE
jgi:hypothetical protein